MFSKHSGGLFRAKADCREGCPGTGGVLGKMADEIGFCPLQSKAHRRKGAQPQAHPVITAPESLLWISLYKHQLSAHQRPKDRTYHRQIVNSTENTLCDYINPWGWDSVCSPIQLPQEGYRKLWRRKTSKGMAALKGYERGLSVTHSMEEITPKPLVRDWK